MKSYITSEKIQFQLTRDDFQPRFSTAFNVIFIGSTVIGIPVYCCSLIIPEWLSTTYNLSIFLLLLSPVLLLGAKIICDGIFPFLGELVLTIDAEKLFLTSKIFTVSYTQHFLIKDIVEIGQLYCGGLSEYEDGPPIFSRHCFIKTNRKQTLFGDYIRPEYRDVIVEEINEFIFTREKLDDDNSFNVEDQSEDKV